jgi:histidinol phosphatase-like enzyme (inositol monophosphatase family)
MSSENLSVLRDFAAELAWHAGRLTLRYFQTGVTVDTKADESPVTIADREAEALMRQMITARYPEHSILGEEEGETRPGAAFRWILDPIDGTKSFIHGVPFYSVLVGLEREGEVVVGAINCPATNDLLVAANGQGCFWNGRRTQVNTTATLSDAILLVTDAEGMAKYGKADAYQRLVQATRFVRTWGDAYGYTLVATGRAEVMLDAAMSPWDCAALLPVLREAGGSFTDWNGEPTIYGDGGIGTNQHLFAEVMAAIRR